MYKRPANSIKTSGEYLFKTKNKTYELESYLFERQGDTEDSLQIQDELRGELGSILIKNSSWGKLSKGDPIRAKSSKGNVSGVLVRAEMFKSGGGIGFIPMDLQDELHSISKRGGGDVDSSLDILKAETIAYSIEKYGEPIDEETFMVSGLKKDGEDVKFRFVFAETVSGKDIKLTPEQLFDNDRATKFKGGGEITKSEYQKALSDYDKYGEFLEDAIEEGNKYNIEKYKKLIEDSEMVINRYERKDEYAGGGSIEGMTVEERKKDLIKNWISISNWSRKPLTEDSDVVKTFAKKYNLGVVTVAGLFNEHKKPYRVSSKTFAGGGEVEGISVSRLKSEFKKDSEIFRGEVVTRNNNKFKIEGDKFYMKTPEKDWHIFRIIKGEMFAGGGEISKENKESIAKLQKLIDSDNPMITDAVKEKAKKKIEELSKVVNSKMLPESVKTKAKSENEKLEKQLHADSVLKKSESYHEDSKDVYGDSFYQWHNISMEGDQDIFAYSTPKGTVIYGEDSEGEKDFSTSFTTEPYYLEEAPEEDYSFNTLKESKVKAFELLKTKKLGRASKDLHESKGAKSEEKAEDSELINKIEKSDDYEKSVYLKEIGFKSKPTETKDIEIKVGQVYKINPKSKSIDNAGGLITVTEIDGGNVTISYTEKGKSKIDFVSESMFNNLIKEGEYILSDGKKEDKEDSPKIKVGDKIGFLRPETGKYEYANVLSLDDENINLVAKHPKKTELDNYFTETKNKISKGLKTESEDWKDGRALIVIKQDKKEEAKTPIKKADSVLKKTSTRMPRVAKKEKKTEIILGKKYVVDSPEYKTAVSTKKELDRLQSRIDDSNKPKKETSSWKEKLASLKNKKGYKGNIKKLTKPVAGTKSRNIKRDLDKKALPMGKRISKDGNVYYERRSNRSDVDPKENFGKGGEVKSSGWGINTNW